MMCYGVQGALNLPDAQELAEVSVHLKKLEASLA